MKLPPGDTITYIFHSTLSNKRNKLFVFLVENDFRECLMSALGFENTSWGYLRRLPYRRTIGYSGVKVVKTNRHVLVYNNGEGRFHVPHPVYLSRSVLQCGCSVLQCVAVCCSVLQCVAVCCSVLQPRTNRYILVYNNGEGRFHVPHPATQISPAISQKSAAVYLTSNFSKVSYTVCCSILQCGCRVLQCVAVCCQLQCTRHAISHCQLYSVLQRVAVRLQCVAVCCSMLPAAVYSTCNVSEKSARSSDFIYFEHTATRANTLQHMQTHCNTCKHTATHANTLQHTQTHCNTCKHTATQANTLQHM